MPSRPDQRTCDSHFFSATVKLSRAELRSMNKRRDEIEPSEGSQASEQVVVVVVVVVAVAWFKSKQYTLIDVACEIKDSSTWET